MAYSFGLPKEEAEDLVQDMYIRIYNTTTIEKIQYNDEEVNTFYVYITMRNLFYDNKKAEVEKVDIDTIRTIATEYQDHNKEELEVLLDKMNQCIEELHWYDKKIFEIYYGRGETIRQLSAGTKISSSSIFNTIKNVRETIKAKCEKEYKDYSQE